MQIDTLTIVVLVFLLAGAVKGMIGLGLPTIAMGLLTLAMPPSAAASLLLVPSFITNVWQLWLGPSFGSLLRRLWPLLAGLTIGTLTGALTGGLPGLAAGSAWTHAALGVVLVAYGCWGLAAARLPAPGRHEKWLSAVAGYLTGVVTAATGVFVVPAVPYLQALRLPKDDLIQALGLSFTASTVALALQLRVTGALQTVDLGVSVLALVPALAGMMGGQYARRVMSENAFKRCFFVGMIALGAYMAASARL
ncbi:TPA: sulfite exporter TauE/SafE family protein [Burkholderia territorii]|uniref:sulfite exporter TauE/SafE family protein n=1 Tax=Burkholderia territorii TaxID=1503055 RepID=UPI0011C938B8|nr:sulfite exporter TauE/SafE family protein [Burkholderia territorii]TXG07951.1 sulfite exporter TauE/SafE family protein [Burkholderia territorii]HDR8857818.1 sulfite exporter TauE/SafE family protein [Burkholderia territorii]HDR8862126.1 sulfite exporter TauE/SafE family protein [Burkholderia territorii]HDR8862819.1 sulfite exporter TauE/SafE family protein [Burkholderia territorii]HDR8870054.1 sulfite exporter TauE/SafE family protein [Burkholderia territorii]